MTELQERGEHILYKWLLDYQKLSDEIEYLNFKLSREKQELKRWTQGDLAGVPLNENSIASGLEERISEYEYELAHKMNDLYKAKRLISTFKGLDNRILYGKYIEGKTLISIADEIDKSPNYIYNKHAEIMRMIDFAHKINIT